MSITQTLMLFCVLISKHENCCFIDALQLLGVMSGAKEGDVKEQVVVDDTTVKQDVVENSEEHPMPSVQQEVCL